MPTGLLTNDEFLAALGELFTERRVADHGSVHLLQKRMTRHENGGEDEESPSTQQTFPDLEPKAPLPILIRASNGKSQEGRKLGKKIKLSTLVQPDALEAFYLRYAEVCKAGMTGLKKRDRKGAKEKQKAKKKQGAATGADVKKA